MRKFGGPEGNRLSVHSYFAEGAITLLSHFPLEVSRRPAFASVFCYLGRALTPSAGVGRVDPGGKSMTTETNLGKYARPTVDYIFKRVFGTEENKSCLISFLNSLLCLQIAGLEFENTELAKEAEREKGARLDVLATLQTGEKVNIEVQMGNEGDVDKRSLFYSSRLCAGQEILGKKYSDLVPVYCIFILNFEWFKYNSGFAQSFVLKNAKTNAPLF